MLLKELPAFVALATRHLFFTGKGGVGKTTLACATAVALADQDRNVLLVSTDPASNLDEVLATPLQTGPTKIFGERSLWALNIDPFLAAASYREGVLSTYRGILPEAALAAIEEQLSGACTVEIAAFQEFARLIGDPAATAQFDHVVFDTAPGGHTLRLLSLPAAWSDFLRNNTTGVSCLGPLAGLQAQQALFQAAIGALSDPARSLLVLVARPQTPALETITKASAAFAELGLANQHLVINGVFRTAADDDPVSVAMDLQVRAALAILPQGLIDLPRTELPLLSCGPLGIEALRHLWSGESWQRPAAPPDPPMAPTVPLGLEQLIDQIAAGRQGVILTMGKGGVGKTTVAALVAQSLARRGHHVQLILTSGNAADQEIATSEEPNLEISHLDSATEVQRYRAEIMADAGANLDEAGKALLEEELNSPCTEEVAVFRAFAQRIAQCAVRFVVLDTAPTGHTLLLVDAALAYHREVTRQVGQLPGEVQDLLPRLRDPVFTRVLLMTLPEATPVHEAAYLQQDLIRAGITPFAWVINQSLLPLATTNPLLRSRQAAEQRYFAEVIALAKRVAVVPWRREMQQTPGGHGTAAAG